MALWKQLVVFLGFAFLATQTVLACDPGVLADYGLMNATSGADFTSTSFEPKNIPVGGPVTLVANFFTQFQGLTGLSISSLYFQLAAGALVPLHYHPRGSELFFVLTGTWYVGFIDTSGKLFDSYLQPGDQFVFPVGLTHFQLVTSKTTATGFSGFNSALPGLFLLSTTFESTPPVPDSILEGTYNTDSKTIDMLRKGLMG
ncbi:unnamed protein product [Calypogeia fissa]